MKIAVIGAGGRSGIAFVKAAIEAGHDIRAGIHSHDPFPDNKHIDVHRIDGSSEDDVHALIQGCDAVVCLVGHVKDSPKDIQTNTIANVIKAMKSQHIDRLVSLTGTGVRLPHDRITLLDIFLNLGVSLIDPSRVNDGKRHFEIIKNSGLNWTVLRVLKLQNTKPRKFSLTLHGPAKTIVSREEVAKAILEILKSEKFSEQAPIVSR